jgi:hypothetical protein
MSRQTSRINYGISRARGYELPKYVCFDCGRVTGATMQVRRHFYAQDDGAESIAMVCRNGSGCHKATDGREIPPYVAPQN